MRHQRQTERVEQRAGAQHPDGAEAIGDDAAKRLADAPQQILQGERESKDVAAPMMRGRHRREKEAERRARAESDDGDQTAAADDQRRRAPAADWLGRSRHIAPAMQRFE
jgi:hypothetical protein